MKDLITNQIFLTVFTTFFIAHLIKFIIQLLKKKKPKLKEFFSSGGFPSAHTGLVSTLFFLFGLKQGWGSNFTIISGVLAVIVIYDAMNVRLEAGRHAKALNKINKEHNLKENLGHNYIEVLGGFVLGCIISLISWYIF